MILSCSQIGPAVWKMDEWMDGWMDGCGWMDGWMIQLRAPSCQMRELVCLMSIYYIGCTIVISVHCGIE